MFKWSLRKHFKSLPRHLVRFFLQLLLKLVASFIKFFDTLLCLHLEYGIWTWSVVSEPACSRLNLNLYKSTVNAFETPYPFKKNCNILNIFIFQNTTASPKCSSGNVGNMTKNLPKNVLMHLERSTLCYRYKNRYKKINSQTNR